MLLAHGVGCEVCGILLGGSSYMLFVPEQVEQEWMQQVDTSSFLNNLK